MLFPPSSCNGERIEGLITNISKGKAVNNTCAPCSHCVQTDVFCTLLCAAKNEHEKDLSVLAIILHMDTDYECYMHFYYKRYELIYGHNGNYISWGTFQDIRNSRHQSFLPTL